MVKTTTVINVFWTKVKVKDPQENERTLVHRYSEVVGLLLWELIRDDSLVL